MISGETEAIYANFYDDYDHFLFFGKKNKKSNSPQDKAKRRARRKQFWAKLGQKVQEGGGAEGIGKTVDNVFGLFGKKKPAEGANYEIGVVTTSEKEEKESKAIPTAVWIVGGIMLTGILAWSYTRAKMSGNTKPVTTK